MIICFREHILFKSFLAYRARSLFKKGQGKSNILSNFRLFEHWVLNCFWLSAAWCDAALKATLLFLFFLRLLAKTCSFFLHLVSLLRIALFQYYCLALTPCGQKFGISLWSFLLEKLITNVFSFVLCLDSY